MRTQKYNQTHAQTLQAQNLRETANDQPGGRASSFAFPGHSLGTKKFPKIWGL